MKLAGIDYVVIFGFFALTLSIGIYASRKSGKDTSQYFLSGRNMPWWLLGMSMVATTFSTDTPNLVTDLVRTRGVAGNWLWWAFLITGMLTVFIYARLWRKSNVTTDLEFYELRYGGKPAAFLRGFRSIYLGLIFNVFAMAAVTLGAIKIGEVMLGLSPLVTIGLAGLITVIFSALGGFRGVVFTDFVLFFVAMSGSIGAAYFSVNHEAVGGISKLLSHPNVVSKIEIFPDFGNTELFVTLLVIPLAVQWWSAWYPGAEPGGGGYVAQRMLAAKDENHAIGATFFFNILHYALRPWAWILVALASLVVFPDVASIKEAFPLVSEGKLGDDLAYPAMLTFLPAGLMGLVMASLVAAYMSTISTHLNWGASYIVNDFYRRIINADASEKTLVNVGRLSTVLLMLVSTGLALSFTNAAQVFEVVLMFGAGSGLIFLLRWFWWRINAWSEIAAMSVSGVTSILLTFTPLGPAMFGTEGALPGFWRFPFVVVVTTISWVVVTFLTKPEKDETLIEFYKHIEPGGIGWEKIIKAGGIEKGSGEPGGVRITSGIIASVLGMLLVYSVMFGTGYWLYGRYAVATVMTILAIVCALLLKRAWTKLRVEQG
ncbi:MAG: Na+:solute symporter [Pyrinomonadaceae bacterium]|nr:Na+:solute symporter [Pyrinomonadaceae bacterium]